MMTGSLIPPGAPVGLGDGSVPALDVPTRGEVAVARQFDRDAVHRRLLSALNRTAVGTRRAYDLALRSFAAFAGHEVGADGAPWWDVICAVVDGGRVMTGDLVDRFAIACEGLAPATIAQRLAAVRWAITLLHEAGVIDWTVRVRAPRVTAYRDTRGPGLATVMALYRAADATPGLRGLRDAALVRALFVLGLRRGEITGLRVVDWDAERSTLSVLGKGRADREMLSVAPDLAARLGAYLAAREELEPTVPLFVTHGPRSSGRQLQGDAIRRTLRRLSSDAGLVAPVKPHGLRHAAITAALDVFQGDVRRVARFSRHKKVETVLLYDDHRRDLAGEVSRSLEDLTAVRPAPAEPASKDA